MNTLLKKIATEARHRGYSVEQTADRAGITKAYLYRVIKGEQQPSLEVVQRLAKAVGLRVKVE